MTFEEFEARADTLFESIPEEMRGGVEYLVVERRALRHPEMPDVFTLGECATGELDLGAEFGELPRSAIHLYWGSFRGVAAGEEDFDWEGELWETLTHELRHHRESGAGEDALEDFDVAADENFKRRDGAPFDPLFYRMGEREENGWFEVDGDRFAERIVTAAHASGPYRLTLEGRDAEVDAPDDLGDVHYLYLEELSDPLDVALVLVRRRGMLESLRALLRREQPRVLESSARWRWAE